MRHEDCYQQFLVNNPYPRELTIRPSHSPLINFSTNDYLGLAHHPLLIERSVEYIKKLGAGATSSRSVAGNFAEYITLEKKIARAMGKPAALILGTGYQTNATVLEALWQPKILGNKPLVFCDRFCHASMLAARAQVTLLRFQHNNINHLSRLLEKCYSDSRPKFILAESLYSMEGDQADLQQLIKLAKEHHAFLYIDDAHAMGIYGKSGFGLAPVYAGDIDLMMGTFSKGAGSFGGYVACSDLLREYLVNKCRGFIYSTGLPPAVLGAIDAALELLPQLSIERERILQTAKKLREFLQQHQLNTGNSTSHIVPWIIGDAKKTVKASRLLEQHNILAAAIRPPSVPVGQSRIRFCLNALHSPTELAMLQSAILVVREQI